MQNTYLEADFTGFGYRELDLAADLLKAHANNPAKFLGDGLKVGFNANSGEVFLKDEMDNVAVLGDTNTLVQFFTCFNCGCEGTGDIILNENGCNHCKIMDALTDLKK